MNLSTEDNSEETPEEVTIPDDAADVPIWEMVYELAAKMVQQQVVKSEQIAQFLDKNRFAGRARAARKIGEDANLFLTELAELLHAARWSSSD